MMENCFVILLAFELALSLFAAWPLLRQLGHAPYRRRSPCKVLLRIGLLIAYTLILALAAFYLPSALHVSAVAAGSFLVWERWRARPAYGRSRRLPPGSLGLVPGGIMRDACFIEKQIKTYGPVFKTSRDFHPYICLYGHERGLRFLKENDESLRGIAMPFSRLIPKGFLRYMDPAIHTDYRILFLAGMSSQTIDEWLPYLESNIRQTLHQVAVDCGHSPTGKVDPDHYLRDMLFLAFVPMFFGIQRNDPLFPEIQSLYKIIDSRRNWCGTDRKKRRATEKLIELIRRQAVFYTQESEQQEDMPHCILQKMVAADSSAAQDKTILGNLIYMIELGGLNDTPNLIRWILKMLMQHPTWLDLLLQPGASAGNTADSDSEQAAERIVKETLRLQQIEFLLRKSTRDIEFEGFLIPKNWSIRICIREGNRDAEVFAQPDSFDPNRFKERNYSNVEYSPFGLFRHNCLGAYLTQRFCQAFILQLANGFELAAASDWPVEHGKSHWEPRRGYEIELRRKTGARQKSSSLKQEKKKGVEPN